MKEKKWLGDYYEEPDFMSNESHEKENIKSFIRLNAIVFSPFALLLSIRFIAEILRIMFG